MKWKLLVTAVTLGCMAGPAFAQAPAAPGGSEEELESIIVTGSNIKRKTLDSASPLQVITIEDLARDSINSPEQLIMSLSSNGTGLDNLASNADVVAGQARGNNGASSANLRGQGANATLILLNGRRVAAHGLNGGVVDINQIPLAAIARVEVLKDGASAIYGTDAVGGVINFITRNNFHGVNAQGFMDVTEAGGGNIFRGSITAGYGKLEEQGFNIFAAFSYSKSNQLRGDQRSFVDTFQPERGVSVDTRGTPFATIFPLCTGPNTPQGTIITSAATAPFLPGSTTVRAGGGINPLALPGNLGCNAVTDMEAYDALLWDNPTARFACAWDTGQAAVLQQPIRTLTGYARATAQAGDHEFYAEFAGSKADSAKKFSNLQITPNTTTQNYGMPRTAANAAVYDRVFNQLVAAFPTDATLAARRGLPISFRWRCIECGRREIETDTETARFSIGADGPLFGGWDYRAGVSYSYSDSSSLLGGGYHYRNTLRDAQGNVIANGIIDALNTGIINPFLLPGEQQSAAALALIESTSARGVRLYGGKYSLWQVDSAVSGPVFDVWGGTVQAAVGVDYRKEKYKFNGDARAANARPVIIAAPFDDANALPGADRDIKAAYAELLIPLVTGMEINLALRHDDYEGFGGTTNPKVTVSYRPIPQVMLRGGYNTGFRVPTFNQIFNGQITSQYSGRDLVDPARCPTGRVNTADPNCQVVQPLIVNGGRLNLGPEDSKQFGLGIVIEPTNQFSLSVDWWHIERTGTIQVLQLTQLIDNFALFPERFLRDASNNLIAIDQTWINSGETVTSGIEVAARGRGELWGGNWSVGLDGTYLLKKKSRLTPTANFSASEVGVFTFGGDLGLRWKHNAFITYSKGDWTGSLTQNFRLGYKNQVLPGVQNGLVNPPNDIERVDNYVTYNLSLRYDAFEWLSVTAGVKNIFDKDPPFAITYDSSTGGGSTWEPRVADPRGRSFTLLAELKF
jgi:iron complex outermembrane recepter protein